MRRSDLLLNQWMRGKEARVVRNMTRPMINDDMDDENVAPAD